MTIRKSPTRAHEIPYAFREDFAELSLFLDINIFGGALTLNFETQSHRKVGAPFINAVA
jgi:hypothetical protein